MAMKFEGRDEPKSRKGWVPDIHWTRDGAAAANEFVAKWPKRAEDGKGLLLLHVGGMIINEIERRAPTIQGYRYADDLFLLQLPDGSVGIAIAQDDAEQKGIENIGRLVLQDELGLVGPIQSHWKPALRMVAREKKRIQALYVEYVETGRSRFQIPTVRKVSEQEFEDGSWFQQYVEGAASA